MLHMMILTIVLLMIAVMLAMRRVEEDILRRYLIDRDHPDLA